MIGIIVFWPVFLVLIEFVIGALAWDVVLRQLDRPAGLRPFAFGYFAGVGGWLLGQFVVSDGNVLLFLLGAPAVMLVLVVFGLPIALALIRAESLGFGTGAAALVVFVFTAAGLVFAGWPHGWWPPLASYGEALKSVAAYSVPPGAAAIIGLVLGMRCEERTAAAARP